MENKTLSKAAAMAQFRLAVIAPVIHGLYPDASRNAYYERITGNPFTLPDGSVVRYSPGTISKWVAQYQNGGIETLMPRKRVNKGNKPGMFDAIQGQVFHLYKEKRQPLLLAVDEAQYLSTAILNDIKMLMNYRYDSVNCFTLILCGEPYLNNTLRKPVHEALRQRITVHYTFSGLSDAEVADYVRHKLVCAGGAETIIDPTALSALHSHSQGNPRVVDNLVSDVLLLDA